MDTTLVISLSENQAHLALIQCKNPYSALLYVYGCANGGYINLSFAKEELGIDDFSLKKAADCLLAYGICKVKKDRVSEIKGDFDEIAALRDTDYGFAGICQMYESAKGKIMRPPEIESLYNIYVNLNMSADMITLLIGFLNEKGRFSLRNIEKTASEWHDAEITSYEAAEEYLNRKFAEKTVYRDILKLLGISGRDAVADEKKYIDRWLKADISHSLISLAYEKTIYNIHELKWPYIDKILSNWNKSGYKTPEDVEKGEKSPPAKPEKADSERDKIARLLEIYDSERRRREETASRIIAEMTAKSEDFAKTQRSITATTRKIAASFVSGENPEALRDSLDRLCKVRENILRQYGYTTDMIDPKPKCEKCGDHGFIGSEMCSCFKERLKKM